MANINWKEPIEAVHTDGRVQPVILVSKDSEYAFNVEAVTPRMADWVNGNHRADGSSYWGDDPWTIRNVQPTLRTADEALARMERLVERLASRDLAGCVAEANAIQALRNPVDPRLTVVTEALAIYGVKPPIATLYARDVLAALDAMPK